jgi:uncharacterized membrane protein
MKKFFINLGYFTSYSTALLAAGVILLSVVDMIKYGGSIGDLVSIIGISLLVSIIGFIIARVLPATQKKKLRIIPWIICSGYIIFYIVMLITYKPTYY